jgi:hypothetical protein
VAYGIKPPDFLNKAAADECTEYRAAIYAPDSL